jgi:hypothetical protein
LAQVDRNVTNLDPNRLISVGYVLPDPGLFLGVATESKAILYLTNWLIFRSTLIYRVSAGGSSARPISSQLWRSVLHSGWDGPQNSGVGNQRRKEFLELLGNCIDEGKGSAETFNVVYNKLTLWRNVEIKLDPLPVPVVHEILWELYELNFRFELTALDSRLTTAADKNPETRQAWIKQCFPTRSLIIVDFKHAQEGLAAESWKERAPYIVALWKVVKTWSTCPQPLKDIVDKAVANFSEGEILGLEQDVARYYTQSFYNHFSRAAIVPHRLHLIS